MKTIEILHVSDLHWVESSRADRMIVIEALVKDVRALIAAQDIRPDMVIFSGDLAQSGENADQFSAAHEYFLKPLLDAANLPLDRLFVAPGNHDISREMVRESAFIERGLRETLSNVDEVNRYIDGLEKGIAVNLLGIERLKAFYEYVDRELPATDASHPLLRLYRRDIQGMKVGVACFNTAWRATGEEDDIDRNHLLIGERNVDFAVEALKGCEVNLAVMHHPTEWLAEFDEFAVASRLSQNFDVVFCGHTHRPLPQTRTTAQGTAILSQAGSVYASRRWFNGYQVVRVDPIGSECAFTVRSYYDTPRRAFDVASNVAPGGIVRFPYAPSPDTEGRHRVESFLREMRPVVRQNAVDHMNMIDADGLEITDIKEAFVPPPLSRRTIVEEGSSAASTRYEDVSIDEILRLNDNYLITGARETGKTSILHYMSVLIAEGICDSPRIPVLINARSLKPNLYNLKRAITSYYGTLPRNFDVEKSIKDGDFLFLVDDVGELINKPGEFTLIEDHPKNRWICITTPRASSITGRSDEADALPDFVEARIGMLPRRSIRAMTRRWSPAIGHSDDEVFDVLMKQIKRDGLPRTGYIVTLLLWAMQQEKELDRINEAILLSNVVDHLLGKADFTQSVLGKFDPRAKEIVLEHLAEYLKPLNGAASVNDVTSFLVGLFRSKRLPFAAVDTLGELTKCGILDRSDDVITFKYPCFGEYFYASRMRSDPTVFSQATSDGQYIESARELELLAGLRRQNSDLLKILVNDITVRLPADIAAVSVEEFDTLSDVSLGLSVTQKKLSELKKKRLSSEQIDDLMDAAERRATRRTGTPDQRALSDDEFAVSEPQVDLLGDVVGENGTTHGGRKDRMTPLSFILANDLLARVIRNSDFTDFEVKAPATKFVLQNSVKLCLMVRRELLAIFDELLSRNSELIFNEDEKNAITYVLSKLVTTLSALALSEQLSSPNVIPMAEELLADKSLSTAERIYLCFLLQGCRAERWHEHFSELLRDKGNSGFVVECITERIQAIVNTQYLDDRENAKLHHVIDTAAEVLNWSTGLKGQVFSDLKKSALQADLRDDRV